MYLVMFLLINTLKHILFILYQLNFNKFSCMYLVIFLLINTLKQILLILYQLNFNKFSCMYLVIFLLINTLYVSIIPQQFFEGVKDL